MSPDLAAPFVVFFCATRATADTGHFKDPARRFGEFGLVLWVIDNILVQRFDAPWLLLLLG